MKLFRYINILCLSLLLGACTENVDDYNLVHSNNPWYENGLSYVASDAVDLGLPSGIKWASYNVGASKPEDCGGYYAWGETETKSEYTWETYKWCNGSENTMTKYCTDSSSGTVDNKTVLEPEDDVAHVKWGGDWRMPTRSEQDELREKCTWVWTTLNGVKGYEVTGPNGKSIFLPAAGCSYGTELSERGFWGEYWSSSLNSSYSYKAYELSFNSSGYDWYSSYRCCGLTVRPVMGEPKIEPEEPEEPEEPKEEPKDEVDLGLPSGIKWATCNVGASAPEDYGGYYAWGETEEKSEYTWETYKWCNGSENTMTKYCTDSSYGTVDNKTVLEPEDDVAHVKWGGDWRMPTHAEQQELIDECTWVWTTINGIRGYEVTGPNGKSIFLPAAGCRYGTELSDRGSWGQYWSSILRGDKSSQALGLMFYDSKIMCEDNGRCVGLTVRPVMGEPKIEPEEPKEEPKEKVDLGLPSGIKWASYNVGASAPEDYGDYYAWGETEEKSEYTWETYKWCNGSEDTMTKYCIDSSYGTVDNKTVLEPEDDVAHVKWGGDWRMPTHAEQQELIDECTWVWTILNNIEGYRVTGPNGKSIFLPAAGIRYGTYVYSGGGTYWSSSLNSASSNSAYYLLFGSSDHVWYVIYRCYGHTVRPVSE